VNRGFSIAFRSIALLLVLQQSSVPTEGGGAPASPQVLLSADSASVPLDGILSLEVRLVNANQDDADVVVYRRMSSGVVLQARTPDGSVVRPKGFTHYHELCPPPPPKQTDFVSLGKGQFLGQTYRVDLAYLGIDSPGSYSIVASYWFDIASDESGWHLSLSREPVESVPIRLVVLPKKEE